MAQRYALAGRIVTMDAGRSVLPRGVIYVDGQTIQGVLSADAPPPDGFAACPLVDTTGTIYPGLIDLHNHLSYDILPLWAVPRAYQCRDQWNSAIEKRQFISGPMELLADQPGYVEAIVRYVECKCLLAGVTTTQGITLAGAPGIERKYRGVVRNVEATDDPALPEAGHRIGDVQDAAGFLTTLQHERSCYVLHLSEGVTVPGGSQVARAHFLNLRLPDGRWAITNVLAGIHSTGLLPEDFDIVAANGGSMVWSPLSNLLLYGDTANVRAARASGVRIALGADWSPTGSKHLLGELKAARIYSELHDGLFSDEQLAALATIEAARILKWDGALGSLEPGKRADLLVVASQAGGPYEPLLSTGEGGIGLVVIDGVPRYGLVGLMDALGVDGELWTLAGQLRLLNLADAQGDPLVGKLTLAEAQDRLRQGLAGLPTPPPIAVAPPLAAAGRGVGRWRLVLDNDGPAGRAQRLLAPPPTSAEATAALLAAAIPLKDLVKPMALDPLTVAEDPAAFFDRLQPQPNLPTAYKDGLPAAYRL